MKQNTVRLLIVVLVNMIGIDVRSFSWQHFLSHLKCHHTLEMIGMKTKLS